MIDLYAAPTANGVRARIALEECGLAYDFHPVALQKGEHKTSQFLAMNPNGQIPVIKDSEGPGGKPVVLSQSAAILLYCAEKTGKHLPKDPVLRPQFLQGLMSTATDIVPTLGSLFMILLSKERHQPSADLFRTRWAQYLKVWDQILNKQRYCVGDEVTIVDFSLYAGYARAKGTYHLPGVLAVPELCEGFPNLERWAKEIGARPALQRALKF